MHSSLFLDTDILTCHVYSLSFQISKWLQSRQRNKNMYSAHRLVEYICSRNIYNCNFFLFISFPYSALLLAFLPFSSPFFSPWLCVRKTLDASSPLPENHCNASVVSNSLPIHSYLKNCIWQWFQNRPVSIVECSGICGCLLFLLASVSNSTTFILGSESSRKWVHWNLTPSQEWETLYMQTSRCAKTVEVTIVG